MLLCLWQLRTTTMRLRAFTGLLFLLLRLLLFWLLLSLLWLSVFLLLFLQLFLSGAISGTGACMTRPGGLTEKEPLTRKALFGEKSASLLFLAGLWLFREGTESRLNFRTENPLILSLEFTPLLDKSRSKKMCSDVLRVYFRFSGSGSPSVRSGISNSMIFVLLHP